MTFFSLEEGKKRAIAYGVEKPHSKKRGSVQPFSRVILQLRRGRELDTVAQADTVCMYPALHGNLDGLTAAAYVAELVDAFTMPEEPFPRLFRLIDATWQEIGKGYDQVLLRAFEIRFLTVIGYRPHLKTCLECGSDMRNSEAFFIPAQGGVLCQDCVVHLGLSGTGLSPFCHQAMLQLLYLPADRLKEIKWPESIARKV
ncbi:MAG: DNA repair protein RecO, partial [Bacillota bacterium]